MTKNKTMFICVIIHSIVLRCKRSKCQNHMTHPLDGMLHACYNNSREVVCLTFAFDFS